MQDCKKMNIDYIDNIENEKIKYDFINDHIEVQIRMIIVKIKWIENIS